MKMVIKRLICNKCEHKWIPRKGDVRQCPKCKTAYWDKANAKDQSIS